MEPTKFPNIKTPYEHPTFGEIKVQMLAKHSESGLIYVVFTAILLGDHYVAPLDNWLTAVDKSTHVKTAKQEEKIVNYPVLNATYQHYKGGLYTVHTLAKDPHTEEAFVVYQSQLFGSHHIRPLSMWDDIIKKYENVYNVRRFTEKSCIPRSGFNIFCGSDGPR